MTSQIVRYNPNEEGFIKWGKCMHSLSVSVCPCVSETVCAHAFCNGIFVCIALTSFHVLTQLKTASSLSWGGSHRSVLTQNTYSSGIVRDTMSRTHWTTVADFYIPSSIDTHFHRCLHCSYQHSHMYRLTHCVSLHFDKSGHSLQ